MMKKLLATCLLLTGISLTGQNLVLNPGFENTTGGCVGFTGGLNNWDDANSGADSCSSPDLFATCFPNGLPTHAPNSWLGDQAPHGGTRYAGLITYAPGMAFNCNPIGSDQYREYIEGQFSSPLVGGQTYCVSFWVNLAGKVNWATNQMSVYFSNTLYTHNFCSNPGVAPVTPQLNYTGPVLSDTTNWVLLSWSYTATGGEQFMTIGNFKNNTNTTRANSNCNAMNPYAYYFIDDVSVVPGACVSCALSTSVLQKNDVTCNGGSNGGATISVSGGSGSQTYTWVPSGGNAASASGLTAGVYTVNITDGSCTASQTVNIGQPTAINANATVTQSVTCSGGSNGSASVNITGGTPTYTVNWNTGASGTTLNNVPKNVYTYTVTDAAGCTTTGTINIPGAPDMVVNSQTGCGAGPTPGSATVTANGGTPGFTYSWTPGGQTTNAVNNLANGSYTCTVTDANNCIRYAQITINCATGINTYDPAHAIHVFPNPADNFVTIDAVDMPKHIELYDAIGQVVYQVKPVNAETKIDLTALPTGVYFIKVIFNDNSIQRFKLLRQ